MKLPMKISLNMRLKIILIGLAIIVAILALVAPLASADTMSWMNIVIAAAGVIVAVVLHFVGSTPTGNKKGIGAGRNIRVERSDVEIDGSAKAGRDLSVTDGSDFKSSGAEAGRDVTVLDSDFKATTNKK